MGRLNIGVLAAAASLLTSSAQAFLIPPGIADAAIGLPGSPLETFVIPPWQAIEIPCSACSTIPDADGNTRNDLSILLNVSTIYDGHAIGLAGGDYSIFPVVSDFAKPIVKLVHDDYVRSVKITSDGRSVIAEGSAPNGDVLIRTRFTILEIDYHSVDIPAVDIISIKHAKDDTMTLIALEPAPSSPLSSIENGDGQGCNMPAVLCQVRDRLKQAASAAKEKAQGAAAAAKKATGGKMMGCGGKGRHHHGTNKDEHSQPALGISAVPEPLYIELHGPASGFEDGAAYVLGGGPEEDMDILLQDFLQVLVPLAFLLSFGLSSCLVGFITGRLLAYLWIKFVRGGQRGNAGVESVYDQDEKVANDIIIVEHDVTKADEEKKSLLVMVEEARV